MNASIRRHSTPMTQPPVIEEEPNLVIPTQVIESLYTVDSSGEKRKRPKPIWEIGQKIQITPREWDADTPMEPPQPEELPRTPGCISPNPELDPHVEILEFEEEEDHNGRTISIKQRKKKKANKRRRESGQPSKTLGKEKVERQTPTAHNQQPPNA